jgi:mRNA interferase MazF
MYRRGDIWMADLGQERRGSEQTGYRPVVIIQNNTGNGYSPTTIVAALTDQNKKWLPCHCHVKAASAGLRKDSVILLEQIRTIDKTRLKRKVASLPLETVTQMNIHLANCLGLRPSKSREEVTHG